MLCLEHRIMKLSVTLSLARPDRAFLLLSVETSSAKKFTVQIGTSGDSFTPALVTVELGDEVEWEWDSSFHSTTSGTPGHPSGVWNSGLHGTGFKFSVSTSTPSDPSLIIAVSHGSCCNMIGTVNVVAGRLHHRPALLPQPRLHLRPSPPRRHPRVLRLPFPKPSASPRQRLAFAFSLRLAFTERLAISYSSPTPSPSPTPLPPRVSKGPVRIELAADRQRPDRA